MPIQNLIIVWDDNSGYSVNTAPGEMKMGYTLNVVPPSVGCTVTFDPPLPKSLSTTPTYPSYIFGGTPVVFTMPTVENAYNFTFSVPGKDGKSGVDARSIPVGKT